MNAIPPYRHKSKWEESCEECCGSGMVDGTDYEVDRVKRICVKCQGLGVQPNWKGEALLEFIAVWQAMRDPSGSRLIR